MSFIDGFVPSPFYENYFERTIESPIFKNDVVRYRLNPRNCEFDNEIISDQIELNAIFENLHFR